MIEHRSLFITLKKKHDFALFLRRLLSKSSSHNQYPQPVTPTTLNAPTTVEPSSLLTTIVPPPPPPPLLNHHHTESTTGKISKFFKRILSKI
jgi:hypothetical protein